MSDRPWLLLIAGPNGAGKTTLASHRFSHLLRVNADEVARDLNPTQPGRAKVAAGKLTLQLISNALGRVESFTVETTLSGKMHFRLVERARTSGYRIGLAYVGIADPETALARVRERYRLGGHNVPAADVLRRYDRSMANLPLATTSADSALIFDNTTNRGLSLMVEVEDRVAVRVVPELPGRLERAFATSPLSPGQPLVGSIFPH